MKEQAMKRMLLGIAAAVITVSVVVGFSLVGSPSYNRIRGFDTKRMLALRNLHFRIEAYRKALNKVPSELRALEERQGNYYGYRYEDEDPETGLPYQYELTSSGGYRLCATFTLALDEKGVRELDYGGYERKWAHPAGRHCYEFE